MEYWSDGVMEGSNKQVRSFSFNFLAAFFFIFDDLLSKIFKLRMDSSED